MCLQRPRSSPGFSAAFSSVHLLLAAGVDLCMQSWAFLIQAALGPEPFLVFRDCEVVVALGGGGTRGCYLTTQANKDV